GRFRRAPASAAGRAQGNRSEYAADDDRERDQAADEGAPLRSAGPPVGRAAGRCRWWRRRGGVRRRARGRGRGGVRGRRGWVGGRAVGGWGPAVGGCGAAVGGCGAAVCGGSPAVVGAWALGSGVPLAAVAAAAAAAAAPAMPAGMMSSLAPASLAGGGGAVA